MNYTYLGSNNNQTDINFGNTLYVGFDCSSVPKYIKAIWHVVKAIFKGALCAIFDKGAYFRKQIALAKKCIKSAPSPKKNNNATQFLKGSGKVIDEVREVTEKRITKLNLSSSIDVTLVRGEKSSITVTADDNILEHIKTDTSGEQLSVYVNKSIMTAHKIQVAIQLPRIPNITLGGAGKVQSSDSWEFENLTVSLSGSGSIKLAKLTGKTLTSTISGSGDLHFEDGEVERHSIQISGSGDCLASNLSSKNARVIISGSGDASVHVSEKMDASISGSGDIYHKGTPTISQSISGSGRIYKS